MKEQYHLISFSGGKDSTAMLLGMLECDMKIDCILFCDTRLEFPAMYDHIAKVEKNIGRKITIVRAEHTYLTVERHRGSTVPLGVWEVDETDEKNLDRYEGYPAFYYKKSVKLNVRSLYGDREQILDAFCISCMRKGTWDYRLHSMYRFADKATRISASMKNFSAEHLRTVWETKNENRRTKQHQNLPEMRTALHRTPRPFQSRQRNTDLPRMRNP